MSISPIFLGHEYRYRIDIGKGDIDAPLSVLFGFSRLPWICHLILLSSRITQSNYRYKVNRVESLLLNHQNKLKTKYGNEQVRLQDTNPL